MSFPDISKFNDKDLLTFLNSFDTILTDCDGVIWMMGTPLDGAVDAVTALQALGKSIFYVSNNGTRTVAHYVTSLNALGYDVKESQVVTPAVTVVHLLRERGINRVHAISSEAFRSDLHAAGVQFTESRSPSDLRLDTIKHHLRQLDKNVGAVVVDACLTVNYVQLLEATQLLQETDCLFVSGAPDLDIPVAPDITLLGPGYILEMMEKFCRRKAVVAAKPNRIVIDVVTARQPTLKPSRTLFIGDSLQQDIGLGVQSGFITLLVLSGITTLEEAQNAPSEQQPHFVAPSLKALVPALHRLVSASGKQVGKM